MERRNDCLRVGVMPTWRDDSTSTECVWLVVAGVCALAAMFVLAVFGVVDMDDTKQREPLSVPAPVYVVNEPVTVP